MGDVWGMAREIVVRGEMAVVREIVVAREMVVARRITMGEIKIGR